MTRLTVLHTSDRHGRVEQVFPIATLARRIKQTVTAGSGHGALWGAGDAAALWTPTIAGPAEDFGRSLLYTNMLAPEILDDYLTRQRQLGRSISASS